MRFDNINDKKSFAHLELLEMHEKEVDLGGYFSIPRVVWFAINPRGGMTVHLSVFSIDGDIILKK